MQWVLLRYYSSYQKRDSCCIFVNGVIFPETTVDGNERKNRESTLTTKTVALLPTKPAFLHQSITFPQGFRLGKTAVGKIPTYRIGTVVREIYGQRAIARR